MKALDVEAVQAFVLVADLNSFTRAAEAMDSTQSAISLKIKRLEDGLGRRLIEADAAAGSVVSGRKRVSRARRGTLLPRISPRSAPLRSSIAG